MKNRFVMADGRVQTRSLEVHIVDHCNLRCAACCSLSPHLPRWHMAPEILERDLRLARHAIAPTWLKLVGGEPLLHPDLVKCLQIAKAAQVAPILSVTTNGFLLPKQPEAFWQCIDALTISLYPVPALPEETIALTEVKAVEHGVRLNWKRQNEFVQMDRASRCDDEQENQSIWDECWLRRRCHMIRDGVFYACTRPAHMQTLLNQDFTGDGVMLHEGPALATEVLNYLHRPEPLQACRLCLGGNAPGSPHRQLNKGERPLLECA